MYTPFRARNLESLRVLKIFSTKIEFKNWKCIFCNGKRFGQDGVCIFLAGNLKGIYFKFLAENVVRGNTVQIFPNFPAKSLSI